jgi:hypothetical protein
MVRVGQIFDPHPQGLNLEQFSTVVQEVRQRQGQRGEGTRGGGVPGTSFNPQATTCSCCGRLYTCRHLFAPCEVPAFARTMAWAGQGWVQPRLT